MLVVYSGMYFNLLLSFISAGFSNNEHVVPFWQNEIDELKKMIDVLQTQVQATEKTTAYYAERLVKVENILDGLGESSISAIIRTKTNYQTINGKMDGMGQMEHNFDCHWKIQRREFTESQVAFYVKLSASIHGLSPHEVVIFDEIVTNTSAIYDVTTGIFTAPVHGMYVLSWTTSVNNRQYQSTELVVDGEVKAAARTDTADTGDGDYGSTSQTVVLEVSRGKKVWIRSGDFGSGDIHGADYSTFSGFLLFPVS